MKSKNSTMPNLKDTLQFCIFLVQEQEEMYLNDNKTWSSEARQHRNNLEVLSNILKESESEKMEMSEKQYKKCQQVFGEELAKRLFANVRIVKHDVPPTNAAELFQKIKSKAVNERNKKAPGQFFTENAAASFESTLFSRKSTNGYKDGRKDWPKVATTFAELRQLQVQGELGEQFTMLSRNILESSEFSASVKSEMLSALASEYAKLSRGEN